VITSNQYASSTRMKAALFLVLVGVASISALPRAIRPHGWEKIVGGEEATPHEFPWIVDMRRGGHYCGGSIISEEWVMTAAHCSTAAPSNYELVAGDHHIGQTEGTEQRRQVVRIIRHPRYGNTNIQYENDIALMKVDTPFQFNQYVQPAPIPDMTFEPTERAVVAGWGALTEGGGSPVVLYKVEVPVVSDTSCAGSYGAGSIADSMICAGEGGKDSCQGDSGGPMMCERNGVNYLCGIVSWGLGCARPGYPGVYTEVSYFDEWAQEAILPPAESNETWVEQREGCGGVLSGSSGYISYKLDQSYNQNERCIWTIKAEDRESVRIRVRTSGLDPLASISVTELDYEGATTTNTHLVGDLDSHVFNGPVIFLTFQSGSGSGSGFDLEFYGTSYGGATGLIHDHLHNNALSGSQNFPVGGGSYSDNAFGTFVVNPSGASQVSLRVTRLDIEGGSCSYDWISVYNYANGRFTNLSGKICGNSPPTTTFVGTEGILVIFFASDSSITQTGFTYEYTS